MYPRLSCLRSFLPWLFQVLCIPKETASYAEAPCVFPNCSPFPLPRGRHSQKVGYLIQGPTFMLLLLICRDISSSYIGYSFPFFRPHMLKVAFCTNLPAVFFSCHTVFRDLSVLIPVAVVHLFNCCVVLHWGSQLQSFIRFCCEEPLLHLQFLTVANNAAVGSRCTRVSWARRQGFLGCVPRRVTPVGGLCSSL